MIGYWVHDWSPFLVQFSNGFGIRWYGLSYLLAFFLGYWLYKRLSVQGYADLPAEKVGDFILWAGMLGVFLGGRVGYMLFYGWEEMKTDPLSIIRVWDGGMASHGGILGLVIFTWFYARRHKISWTNLGDNLCVVAPLGLMVVRLANFINGELYGKASTVAWAVQFPSEVLERPELGQQFSARLATEAPNAPGIYEAIEQLPRSEEVTHILSEILTPRHPSQLYQALLEGLLLFLILWFLRTRMKFPNGVLTGCFFIFYAVLRIVGEIFREPDAALIMGISRGQFYSLFMILLGVSFMANAFRRQQYARRWQKQGH